MKTLKNLFTTFLFFLLIVPCYAQNGIFINEILASNLNSINDELGEKYDWIEIYNDNNNDVSLAGYYITDDFSNPTKFLLNQSATDLIVPSKGYLILFASSLPTRGNRHLGFGLSSGGEKVGLYNPSQQIVDTLSFGRQKSDVSFGRQTDGSLNFKYFFPANPAASNSSTTSYIGFLNPPSFSRQGGFFNSNFDLNLSADNGAQIYYTLDGSDPKIEYLTPQTYYYKNSYPEQPGQPTGDLFPFTFQTLSYTSPIAVQNRTNSPNKISLVSTTFNYQYPSYLPTHQNEKGTVVRAIATKPNYLPSDIETNTYLYTPTGTNKYNLPVVSVNITENKLFEYQNGIAVPGYDFDNFRNYDQTSTDLLPLYVGNYYRSGSSYEKTGHIEYFESNDLSFSQQIGIRIHGNRSRHFAQKSFRIYARSELGKESINFPIYKNLNYSTFKRLILRNGGNEFFYTHFKDGVLQDAVKKLNFATQNYQPSVVYLNGEFWGIQNITERYDDEYFKIKYNIDKDSLDLLENNALIEAGSNTDYLNLLDYIRNNDLANSTHYNHILTRIDTENYIDYQSAEIFYSNRDWPGNNIKFWRNRIAYSPNLPYGKDGRWRWAMYDIDNSTGSPWNDMAERLPSFNSLQYATWSDQSSTEVLYQLLKNETFKNQFIVRNADLLNSVFKPERINRMIDNAKEKIKPAIIDHIRRWKQPLSAYNAPIDTSFWIAQINNVKNFLNQRGQFHKQHIMEKFGINTEIQLTLNVNNQSQGSIKLNTILINKNTPGIDSVNTYPWVGNYFGGITNTLEAIPNIGYRFRHWLVNNVINTTPILSINTNNPNTNITAVFESAIYSDNPSPLSYSVSNCEYIFKAWSNTQSLGSFPTNMKFVYMNTTDPLLNAEIGGQTSGVYNLSTRTRINGLGSQGVSFINTSNTSGNVGYPGIKLGGAILALNTQNVDEIILNWKGRTITPNSKVYAIRLQYRIGDIQPFQDLLNSNGQVIEYIRQPNANDSTMFTNIALPNNLLNQSYIQLFWRYYYTGTQISTTSDARDQLALDDIEVLTKKSIPQVSNQTVISGKSYIESSENIPDNSSKEYLTSKSILLKPGFSTNNSSIFKAEISTCSN